MNISLMDIANARLEAITYKRVEELLRTRKSGREQKLYNLAALAAFRGGVSIEDMRGPKRTRDIVWPRQDFMLAAQRAGYSLGEIGRFLNRDHTTIIHGIKAATNREAQQ